LEIRKSVLLPHLAHEMFDLIEAAENYPQFLPWCTKATLLERTDEWVAARLEFSYLKVRFGFQTRNPKRRPEWLELRLVEGPFRNFRGEWRLAPLGDMGCKVSFMIAFDIADGLLDAIARPAANKVAQAMVDAFVKRARSTLREVAPGQSPAPAAAQTESPGPLGQP
jgi:ribosome-associated toxin RatA of RatAB toxin-antitoxin module